jgi:hypothetical protein
MKTPATRFPDEHDVRYTEYVYEYVKHGGTAVSSGSLGVPEHEVDQRRRAGLLVRIAPLELSRILGPFAVSVALKD